MDPALKARVAAAKVLVVGAGGIGCELLKGLVLTGFRALTVVDLDTIDVSNLNRQFLFRPHHVGRPKATCAAEMVSGFAPGVRITAHHGNIKEEQFGVPFVAGFDLVINALDNMDARRHVNRLCLAADKPLIEAGTAGYLGQTQSIIKGRTACIECVPTPPAKSYPICTIRSTPDKPVHCVVWGKELHKLLLGNAKESYLYDGAAGAAAALAGEGGAAAAAAAATYMPAVSALPALEQPPEALALAAQAYAEGVFQAIFYHDIARRLEVAPETYKGARARPMPLDLARCLAGGYEPSAAGAAAPPPAPAPASTSLLPEQRVLTLQASAQLFLRTLAALVASPQARATFGALDFSKDSASCLDLVTSATNLRAAIFSIPLQSRWDVKAIAGSIIPAIATTNAAVAGLQVLEALKLLSGADLASAGRHTFVVREPAGGKRSSLLLATALAPPALRCPACSTPSLTLVLSGEGGARAFTLGALVSGVLKGALGFRTPNVDNGGGLLFCEANLDEDEEEEFEAGVARLLATPLAALPGGGVRAGCILQITEMQAGVSTALCLTVLEGGEGGAGVSAGAGEGWVLRGVRAAMPPPLPPALPPQAAPPPLAGKKRQREGEGEEEEEVVFVEEEEEGGEGQRPVKARRVGAEGAAGASAAAEDDILCLD